MISKAFHSPQIVSNSCRFLITAFYYCVKHIYGSGKWQPFIINLSDGESVSVRERNNTVNVWKEYYFTILQTDRIGRNGIIRGVVVETLTQFSCMDEVEFKQNGLLGQTLAHGKRSPSWKGWLKRAVFC